MNYQAIFSSVAFLFLFVFPSYCVTYKGREIPPGVIDHGFVCGINPVKLEKCLKDERGAGAKATGASFCNDVMLAAGFNSAIQSPKTPGPLKAQSKTDLANLERQLVGKELLKDDEFKSLPAADRNRSFTCRPTGLKPAQKPDLRKSGWNEEDKQ